MQRIKNILKKCAEYAIVFTLLGGVATLLYAHTNKFKSLIVYGTSGITNAGPLAQSGNITFSADGTYNLGANAARANTGYFDELFAQVGANVASAADNFTLGSDGNFYTVTGTTNLDSIAIQNAGKFVVLRFADVLTITDGGLLDLEGNFTTVAGAAIALWSDGSTWHEFARRGGSISATSFTDGTATLTGGSLSGVDDLTMTGQIDGGTELAGTLAFTTSDTLDTLVNANIAATDIFTISLKDTSFAAGVGALKGYECKAGTLFVARKPSGTSAASWSYIRIK